MLSYSALWEQAAFGWDVGIIIILKCNIGALIPSATDPLIRHFLPSRPRDNFGH